MKYLPSIYFMGFLLIFSCSDMGQNPKDTTPYNIDNCGVCDGNGSTCSNISYAETIEPLLSSCIGCHGVSGGLGGLSLSAYTNLMIGGSSGAVVTPGDGSGSRLVKKLRGTASEARMPLGGVFWNDTDINLIETWIDEGALNN